MGRRVGYARVSTEQQTLEQQRSLLKEAGCENVFAEKVSGRVAPQSRPQLTLCLGSLQDGDLLVVPKLDRLGRRMLDVVQTLVSLLDRGVHIKTLDGALDTKAMGSVAPLVVSILGYVAQVEADLIRERTRENYEHRRRTGGKLGGRPPLDNEKVLLARRLREEGSSCGQVARALGLSKSTVHKYTSST